MTAKSRRRRHNQRRNQPPQSQPPLNKAKNNKNRPNQQQLQRMRDLASQKQRNQQQTRQVKNTPTKPPATSTRIQPKETVENQSRKQRRKLKSESRKQRNKKRKQRQSAKKQEKKQMRDQMNRENYLSWIYHYEQSLDKNSREIQRKNQVEIQDLIDKYGDSVLQLVSSGDPEFMILSKPLNMGLLTQAINEARTRHSGIKLDFHNLTDATAITVDFYHNDIRSLEDIDKFIEYVYSHEKGRLFKCTFDFGVAIERKEMPENMKELLKNKKLIHKLQNIDWRYLITYRIKLPDNSFSQLHTPMILFDRNSIDIFKEYVRSSILFMQEFGELTDTKELIVAIFSMQLTSHRLPFPGKNMKELIKIHKKRNIIKYIDINDDYNICFWYNLTCVTMPDAKNVEIDRHKRIAEGKRLLFSFYGIPESNQRKFLKEYPGFNWNDANKVAEKYNININCYEYVGEGFEDDDQKPKYQRLISYPDIQVEGRKPYNILLLNDDIGYQHIMYIINVEKLIGLLICPICNNHAIYAKDENRHVQRKMDAHIKECMMKL